MLKFSLQNSSLSVTEKNMSKTQRAWSCWINTIDIMIHTKQKSQKKKTKLVALSNLKTSKILIQNIRKLENLTSQHITHCKTVFPWCKYRRGNAED